MDRKRALFRAKLNEKKEKRRINSSLVRYNDLDQPVCRVCDVVLKSESLWDAHQASRKHHQAISNLKGSAAVKSQQQPHVDVSSESSKPHSASDNKMGVKLVDSDSHTKSLHFENDKDGPPAREVAEKPFKQVKGGLPEGFFDNKEADLRVHNVVKKDGPAARKVAEKPIKQVKGGLPEGFFDNKEADLRTHGTGIKKDRPAAIEVAEKPMPVVKQAKGALPEGFFDNKEADLRARGIKIVKPDVKDEYKEFEKLIQEDLQEVDNRMEEDEIDAAEVIEEYELLEQKASMEKVEMLKKRRMELEAARLAKRIKSSEEVARDKSSHKDSSSDDDDDDGNFAVDWRAQHL